MPLPVTRLTFYSFPIVHRTRPGGRVRHLFRFLLSPVGLLALVACGRGAPQAGDSATVRDTAAGVVEPRAAAEGSAAARVACAPDNGGMTLPAGFCAAIFADSVGSPRHVAVAPNGDVFVARQLPRARGESGQAPSGGIVVLRDADGDGRAETREAFGEGGGTGIGLAPGWVYFDSRDRIVRYPVAAGAMRPSGEPQVIVSGLPTGGHAAHNFALDGRGTLYVNVGSATNSCQTPDRTTGKPGNDPCVELERRAGIWKYSADAQDQAFSPAQRFATGIRNAVGLTVEPGTGRVVATQHGRDQLYQNWASKGYTVEQSAELPAEELLEVGPGDDFGWPYCYYDQNQKKLVLAPEYGGDGGKAVGRCAQKKAPAVAFPGHWAPMAVLFYTGSQFPARYRDGAFVSFHGSWNRAPLPQAGYRVAFAPRSGGRFTGAYETFAGDFEKVGEGQSPRRPVGLAQGPDGSLYVTDDARGRIWKIVYTGAP
jgi:glucose/arabinose dehydrogenase